MERGRGRRHSPAAGFHTVLEFLWAILEKLSPARRVLLLLGIVFLILPGAGFSHTGKSGEVEFVEVSFHFYAGVLLFIVLMLEISDRVVMKRDLEIARDIQSWLLPATPPPVPGLAIAFATRPANTVAGDYYDVFARPATAPGRNPFPAGRGRRCRQEHSRGPADGDLPGQSQNSLRHSLLAGRTGARE